MTMDPPSGKVSRKPPGAGNQMNSEALLRSYVQSALASKAKGSAGPSYATLVKQLAQLRRQVESGGAGADAEHSLATMLSAITACVSLLRERRHEALLSEVMHIKLWTVPGSVRAAVVDMLVNLMVANSAFVHSCLQVLVFNILPPPASGLAAPADEPGTPWQPSGLAVEVQADVVAAMQKALALVPTLAASLLPMLVHNMPHKLRDRACQCLYLRAALALAEGPAGTPLRDGLLLGVVEHLLGMDVEIKWEDIVDVKTGQEQEEGESEEEEEEQEDIFELEGMAHDLYLDEASGGQRLHQQQLLAHVQAGPRGGWEGSCAAGAHGSGGAAAATGTNGGDASGGGAGVSGRPPVDESADKLDSMMELVLEHLDRRCDAGQLSQVWRALMAAFERSLLHTHRSKFTQFLLFGVARRDPEACGRGLVRVLLQRVGDVRQPPTTRAAAAAYLASFLARAAYAPEALVVDALQQLARLCSVYADGLGAAPRAHHAGGTAPAAVHVGVSAASATVGANGGAGVAAAAAAAAGTATQQQQQHLQQHLPFYAMMQALLYVLCYQLEPLLQGRPQHPGTRPEHTAVVRGLVRDGVVPLLSHPLAPLAACLPSVASEFARQVSALRLAEVSHLLPGATAAAAGGGDGGACMCPIQRPLEMFFPFDPYLLRRSSRLLELDSSYVHWRRGHPGVHANAGGGDGDASSDDEGGADGRADDDCGSSEDGGSSSSSSLHGGSDDGDDDSSSSDGGDGGSLNPGRVHRPAAHGGGARHSAAALRRLHPVRPLPVGLAAAAANLSGPSPDFMATSLAAGGAYLASGGSFSPGGASFPPGAMYGSSPAAGGLVGGSPMLGTSPLGGAVAMSITPVGGGFQGILHTGRPETLRMH